MFACRLQIEFNIQCDCSIYLNKFDHQNLIILGPKEIPHRPFNPLRLSFVWESYSRIQEIYGCRAKMIYTCKVDLVTSYMRMEVFNFVIIPLIQTWIFLEGDQTLNVTTCDLVKDHVRLYPRIYCWAQKFRQISLSMHFDFGNFVQGLVPK